MTKGPGRGATGAPASQRRSAPRGARPLRSTSGSSLAGLARRGLSRLAVVRTLAVELALVLLTLFVSVGVSGVARTWQIAASSSAIAAGVEGAALEARERTPSPLRRLEGAVADPLADFLVEESCEEDEDEDPLCGALASSASCAEPAPPAVPTRAFRAAHVGVTSRSPSPSALPRGPPA